MSEEILMGTVDELSPNPATASSEITSPTSDHDLGTVGTVTPYCSVRARGNDNERAQEDFRETGGQLSPTVPADPSGESGLWWDVHRFSFPFGVGKRLGRLRARTAADAERVARARYNVDLIVTLAGGGRSRMRRDSMGRPLHRGNRGRR